MGCFEIHLLLLCLSPVISILIICYGMHWAKSIVSGNVASTSCCGALCTCAGRIPLTRYSRLLDIANTVELSSATVRLVIAGAAASVLVDNAVNVNSANANHLTMDSIFFTFCVPFACPSTIVRMLSFQLSASQWGYLFSPINPKFSSNAYILK